MHRKPLSLRKAVLGIHRLTSGVTVTTNITTPFAVEENKPCADSLQSHQASQGAVTGLLPAAEATAGQAEELSFHLHQSSPFGGGRVWKSSQGCLNSKTASAADELRNCDKTDKAGHSCWVVLSTGFGIFQPKPCLFLPGPLLLLFLHHDS